MSSYNSASQNFPPAKKADVAAYRCWMEKNAPIDQAETRFLNQENDLVALTARSRGPPLASSSGPINLRQARLVVILAVVLPAVTMTLVSGVVSKIVVTGVLVCASIVVLESSGFGDHSAHFGGDKSSDQHFTEPERL